MADFSIRSIIHDYAVEFIDNTPEILKKEIKNGENCFFGFRSV